MRAEKRKTKERRDKEEREQKERKVQSLTCSQSIIKHSGFNTSVRQLSLAVFSFEPCTQLVPICIQYAVGQ